MRAKLKSRLNGDPTEEDDDSLSENTEAAAAGELHNATARQRKRFLAMMYKIVPESILLSAYKCSSYTYVTSLSHNHIAYTSLQDPLIRVFKKSPIFSR